MFCAKMASTAMNGKKYIFDKTLSPLYFRTDFLKNYTQFQVLCRTKIYFIVIVKDIKQKHFTNASSLTSVQSPMMS